MNLINMKLLKFFKKKSVEPPVVSTHIYCNNCNEDNAIFVKVIDATRILDGGYFNAQWLCKECIRVNIECGGMIEIL
jgi:hypothetical protein